MQLRLDLVQCLVQIPDGSGTGLTQVLKSGPSAVTPPEMTILQQLHNTDADGPERECLSDCRVVGHVDTDDYHERDRLAVIYTRKMVNYMFTPQSEMPQTLGDLHLPDECLAPPEEEKAPVGAEKPKTAKQLRTGLEAMGVDVPVGNVSIADLMALFPKAA